MTKTYRYLLLSLSFLFLVSSIGFCAGKQKKNKIDESGLSAIDAYWSRKYNGPMGIQVRDLEGHGATMFLAEKVLHATGANCFNLFIQSCRKDHFEMDDVEETFKVLAREKVPVVRFSCIPFHAKQYGIYFNHREEYLSNLERVAELADKYHIGLIPSIFWIPYQTALYHEEPFSAIGDPQSKTRAFMERYLTDVMNTLKGHKSIFAWEFGNEMSNRAGTQILKGHEKTGLPLEPIISAYRFFADQVYAMDPEHRLIANGNGPMRNAQWHLLHEKNWNNDSYAQYVEMGGLYTPSHMRGQSEHIYDRENHKKVFSDLGYVPRPEQIQLALKSARTNGNVYYIGEFTGADMTDTPHLEEIYKTYYESGVQLFLVWNFALKGDIEHSFTAEEGKENFILMRDVNSKFGIRMK